MAFVTFFTPTYNRRHTLSRNYEALKKQTSKDFVWMIVDDGSTDGTEELVKQWIQDGEVPIEYFYQVNSGKPSATNFSIEKCTSDLWVCVDSDDYVASDTVEQLRISYEKIKDDDTCCGIIANKFDMNTGHQVGVDGKGKYQRLLPEGTPRLMYRDILYKYKIKADLMNVYKTKHLKKYRYPIFPGEKFIGESYVYCQIGADYTMIVSHAKMYMCEYREDGLTAQYKWLHIKSPKGYKLLKQQVMTQPKPLIDQFKGAIMYVAGCKLCKERRIVFDSPRPLMTMLAYPAGVLAYYVKYYRLIKKDCMRKNEAKKDIACRGNNEHGWIGKATGSDGRCD